MSGVAGENTPSASKSNVERRCDNADCNVGKLVSMVPQRKTTQFVTEPKVMDKPILINGFTTIFQVDGSSAKLSDLKDPQSGSINMKKPIYRVVPNTHAHIVNYVVVDADGESLRKIKENDPATMRKLLESQKVSADQMLKKLMSGAGSSATSATAAPSDTNTGPNSSARKTSVANSKHGKNLFNTTGAQQSSSIQLPARMHPNLQITSVASGETVAALSALSISPPSGAPVVPLIQPVPLASLLNAPAAKATIPEADKPIIHKLQAELEDLRRKVAMLAENHSKD